MIKPIGPSNIEVKHKSNLMWLLLVAATSLIIAFKCTYDYNTYKDKDDCMEKMLAGLQAEGVPVDVKTWFDVEANCRQYDRR